MDLDALTGYTRAAFGLDPDAPAVLTAGPRGALGQVYRLVIGERRYAVKELFGSEPPAAARVAAEVEFTGRAAAAGVRVAAAHRAVDGRYVVPAPGGTGWLRLYDWLDGTPVGPRTGELAAPLGTLLGRLHRCAPATDREPEGSPPEPWFAVPPPAGQWPALVEAAYAARADWASRLADRLPLIQAVTALAPPARYAAAILCHRDLHPENVLVLPGGNGGTERLAVLDWDNLGPADPGGELVRVLLDWFFDHGTLDGNAVRRMLDAYRATGAPGRVTPEAFGFVIASRLNFLRRQIGIALDPASAPGHRNWAAREIEEGLGILPDPDVLARLVATGDTAPAVTAPGDTASGDGRPAMPIM